MLVTKKVLLLQSQNGRKIREESGEIRLEGEEMIFETIGTKVADKY